MSKVVLGSVALGLNGAVIAGGGWLIHTGIQKGKVDAELVDSLEKFKSQGKDNHCVKSMFPGLSGTGDTNVSDVAANDVSLTGDDKKGETEGCLVVNWDKKTKAETGGNNKWSGTIRFLWAVKGENKKGFIVFLAGKVPSGGQKLAWEGIAYQLTAENDVWSISKKRAAKADTNEFTSSTEDNKFPRAAANWMSLQNKSFWGFFSQKSELGQAGEDGAAKEAGSLRGYWTWKGAADGTQAMDSWTQNLDTWWEAIFTKTNWDMANVIKDRKGAWSEVVYLAKPEETTTAKNS